MPDARQELIEIVREKSFTTGDFTLASGQKSKYYIDCRLTTLDARGACLIGEVLLAQINAEAEARGVKVDAVGGMTMGADPISVAVSMSSHLAGQDPVLQAFVVRKEPKGHGQGKQVEGNFNKGDTVVAIEDVITTGGSTLKAIGAMERAGGKVAFVAVLVDRQEGGREMIEAAGYPVISVFTRDELMG
jgi:orotate phosphoribosyltransferase